MADRQLLSAVQRNDPAEVERIITELKLMRPQRKRRLNLDEPGVGDRSEWTYLHYSAIGGHNEAALILLQQRARVDSRDSSSRTPLHRAARNGHDSVVATLLNNGANPNAVDQYRWTPLMHAVQCNHPRSVELLLQHGADSHLASVDGKTPLERAIRGGYRRCVSLLLTTGRLLGQLTALEYARNCEPPKANMVAMLRAAEEEALGVTRETIGRALGAHIPELVREVAELLFSREVWDETYA